MFPSSLLVATGLLSLVQASALAGLAQRAHHVEIAARQDNPAPSPSPAPGPPAPPPPPPPGPSSSPPPAQPGSPSASVAPPGAPSPSGSAPAPSGPPAPPAAPTPSIVYSSNKPVPTVPTYAPGSVPTNNPGAPGLPEPFVFVASEWPTAYVVPPTDSPEVQLWMKELEGHDIPNLSPTINGSCAADPASAADAANRGWWTCAGTTRDTDIVACPDKNTWGLTFDDGPGQYTPVLLQFLKEKAIFATFYVVGGRVVAAPTILIEEYMSGHEISVHTWSHSQPLTSLSNEQIVAELGWTRKAIKSVLGVTPLTMRPPWGDIDDRVRAISMAMGLIPVMWTRMTTPAGQAISFDTNDWMVAGNHSLTDASVATFESILSNATTLNTGFITLEHDIHEITVDLAIDKTLPSALNHNPPFKVEAVGQCMKTPATDIYRETTTNKTFPYPPKVSQAEPVDIEAESVGSTPSTSSAGSGSASTPNNAPGLAAAPFLALSMIVAVASAATCL